MNNVLSNSAVSNNSGCNAGIYQAGVSDQGNNDKIVSNSISGLGYQDVHTMGCGTFSIDASFTNRAKVHANSTN